VQLHALANQLTESRTNVSTTFELQVIELLHKLSMPNARFEVKVRELPDFESHGIDEVTYLFSANLGVPTNPISQIASGGELSRLALSIKSIIADKTNLPTMIFDEVDSGVSGQVALIMGSLIDDLSENYQIISITHSPQVAAFGDEHFFIYKEDQIDRSFTKVKKLNPEERVLELAQMLSGNPPTNAAIMNAKELLNRT
jgi:DNA repair protein RecN (Recombination protein N)